MPKYGTRFDRRRFLERLGLAASAPLLHPIASGLISEALGAVAARRCAIVLVVGENMPVSAPFGFVPPGVPRYSGDKVGVDIPSMLLPLRSYWNKMVIVDGVANSVNGAIQHGMGFSCLSGLGVEGGVPETGGKPRGPTIDQHIASVIGRATPLPSLLLGFVGGLSDYSTTTFAAGRLQPLPQIGRPSIVYQQLLGKRGSGAVAGGAADPNVALLRTKLLESMRDDVKRLSAELAGPERDRLDGYLQSIDLFDKRQQEQLKLLQTGDCGSPPQANAANEGDGQARLALMLRMATMALRCGLTNVVGINVGNGFGHDDLKPLGIPYYGHGDGTDPNAYDKALNKINALLTGMIADVLTGIGALADSTTFLMVPGTTARGGQHHAGDEHVAIIYDGTGTLKTGGRYLGLPRKSRSLMDAYCAFAQASGAPTDRFGAGEKNVVTGPMAELMT
jgi:hypothetical protein